MRCESTRPVGLHAAGSAPLRLVGAWRLTSDDPRFGGISALGRRRRTPARADRFGRRRPLPKPSGRAAAAPDRRTARRPRRPGFKINRDSEALAARSRRPRLVGRVRESRRVVALTTALRRARCSAIALGRRGWRRNSGIEGMRRRRGVAAAAPRGAARHCCRRDAARGRGSLPIAGDGPVSDAVRLGDGRAVVVERRLTPLGFPQRAGDCASGRRGAYRLGAPHRAAARPARQCRGGWRSSRCPAAAPLVADDRRQFPAAGCGRCWSRSICPQQR